MVEGGSEVSLAENCVHLYRLGDVSEEWDDLGIGYLELHIEEEAQVRNIHPGYKIIQKVMSKNCILH